MFGSCGNKVFDLLSVCWVRGSGVVCWREISSFFIAAGNFYYDQKSIFFVVAGNFDYDRKKKIQSSVGGKLTVFLLWQEIFITTGKKKIHYDRKKKDTVVSGGKLAFFL